MGRMHSHAWHTVSHFFETPPPRLVGVVASDRGRTEAFAERWAWPRWETDLTSALEWDGIDLVDVTLAQQSAPRPFRGGLRGGSTRHL